jgi:ABC-type sugar transport system ATPase subunit
VTTPSADDARPAVAGRASALEAKQATEPTGHTQAMDTPEATQPDARPDSGPNARSDGQADVQPLLRLAGIGKNFGPVRALYDINLDIPPGQVTALMGDNGAGKSTLIKTMSGIWQPDHGEIFWEGSPVHMNTPKAADDLGIATVYQDLALCDNLDIVQNMFLGHEPTKAWQLDEISMELAAKQTLKDLSVVSVRSIRQPVGSLSGGQRQAVAVAKAVMRKAKLVIMDEPTAALGVTQTRVVIDLIGRLASQGIAVLVISHNLTDVMSVADRRAVLYLGRLAAVGPKAQFDTASVVDLMTTGASERLVANSAVASAAPALTVPASTAPASTAPAEHSAQESQ